MANPTYLNTRLTAAGTALHDNDDWSGYAPFSGSLSVDSTVSYRGSTSLRMEAASGSSEPRVGTSLTFASPRDFTDKRLSMAVKWELPQSGTTEDFNYRLYDSAGNWIQFMAGVPQGMHGDGWQRLSPGYFDESSTPPDLSDITELDIWKWVGDARGRIWIDDIQVTDLPDRGMVLLTFDDALESGYTEGFEYLQRYAMPATYFVMSTVIGDSGRLTEAQLNEMHQAGCQISAHPQRSTPPREMTESEFRSAVETAVTFLDDRGFDSSFMAWPYGSYDTTTLDVARDYFDCCFTTNGTNGETTITTPMTVGRGPQTKTGIEGAVDRAEQYGELAITIFHGIGTGSSTSIPVADFRDAIDYVHQADVEVITPRDLARRQLV
jgi:peptidoglycan/xylan/chitin deacetylase (PgdA/CDA1 family)